MVIGGDYLRTGGVHCAVCCEPAGKLLALRRRKGAFGEREVLARLDLHGLHRARAAVGVKGDGDKVLDRERCDQDALVAVGVVEHFFDLHAVDGRLEVIEAIEVVAGFGGDHDVQVIFLARFECAGVYRHAAADSPVGVLDDVLCLAVNGRHLGVLGAFARAGGFCLEVNVVDDRFGGDGYIELEVHLADLGVSGVVLVGDLLDAGVIERQDVPTVDLADRAAGPAARAGGREVCALRRAVARQVGIDPILEVFIHLDVVDVARAVHLRRIERRVAAQVQPREAVILALERLELFVAAQVERLDLVVVAV